MRRRPAIILRLVLLTLSVCSPLGAQAVGVAYQIARSNQYDMLDMSGPGLRLRASAPIELRYDYLLTDFRRFENPCGPFPPLSCGPDTLDTSSRVHTLFIAARARLFSGGSFHLVALPELGYMWGTITKRRAATGEEYVSYSGDAPGAGIALELSAARVGGTPIGGWIAARVRGLTHPGVRVADVLEPFRGLDWIRSVEIGVTVSLQPRAGP
jgi:hypothetical protein